MGVFYNTLGIPLAAGVLLVPLGWQLSPMIGAAAMSISSLFVVTNALRLRLFKPSKRVLQAVEKTVTNSDDEAQQKPVQVVKQVEINQQEVQDGQKEDTNSQINIDQQEENKMKYQLKIEGMMCMRCVAHVTNALKGIEGVTDVNVNLESGTADITANATVTADSLKAAVEAQDYIVTEVKSI